MPLTLDFGEELGGEGLLEYSVNDKELTFKLGVLEREFTPLTSVPLFIVSPVAIAIDDL